jgi:hypothetical protein
MVLNIRNRKAKRLARQLAQMDRTGLTEAVVVALREAIECREKSDSPRQAASKILEKHGLAFQRGRKPVPASAYHDLDHDLEGTREVC